MRIRSTKKAVASLLAEVRIPLQAQATRVVWEYLDHVKEHISDRIRIATGDRVSVTFITPYVHNAWTIHLMWSAKPGVAGTQMVFVSAGELFDKDSLGDRVLKAVDAAIRRSDEWVSAGKI